METAMWRVMMLSLLAGVALVGAASAESSGEAAQPKCLKAEVNPVTGHVLCIEPLGAPVEAPPAEAMAPCKAEDVRGQWSYRPSCTPTLEGM
jgi:hypothetical protein